MVSIPRQSTLNKFVWEDRVVASGLTVTPGLQTFSVTFTVPDDAQAWFIQPKLRLHDRQVVYLWDRWSLKMDAEGSLTEEFTVCLNGHQCREPRPLGHLARTVFPCEPTWFSNVLNFECSIAGNRTGLVRLVYQRPRLWSDDASIGILNPEQSLIRLEDSSPYNNHTTVMSYDSADPLLIRPGFSRTEVRGKPLYTHPAPATDLDGEYTIQAAPQITVTAITPQVAQGGFLVVDLSLTNPGAEAVIVDVWTESPVPGTQDLSPLKGPFPLVLGPGESRTWQGLEQSLGGFPPGTYRYRACAGETWPGPRWADGWCVFEVLP